MLRSQTQGQPQASIIFIINKYVKIIEDLFDETTLDVALEERASAITKTTIVSYSFFQDKNMKFIYCDKENNVLYKTFGEPIVLFNDLKSSTKILEELEEDGKIHLYAIYMYYSSLFLSEILDVLHGKMIECTGDGNYSLFLNLSREKIVSEYFKLIQSLKNTALITSTEKSEYLEKFDEIEISFLDDCNRFYSTDDEILRCLFFKIFTIYNIKFNKAMPYMINQFLTRVGCVKGKCKITRIENEHIQQDKLIGSAVYKAAHQAGGKI